MTGPLSTLRVVEFAAIGPVPLAGQLLADMGADVIVIDRASAPADKTDVNRRGKRSVALNLKTPGGLEIALKLVSASDILIEGHRPGVMERLGLGPKDCPPELVYGRMTGWGQEGPLAQTAGHDINYLAMTGALHAMGRADNPPTPPLNLVADYGGGAMFLLFGVLAAVIERQSSGRGQVVDAAMVDGVPAMMGLLHGLLAQGEMLNQREANWLDGAAPFYRCYTCADGKYISVGALEPQFYAALLKGLDLPDTTEQYDRASWPAQTDVFAARFATRSRDAWMEVFEGTDACVASVLDFEEAPEHPANAARDIFIKTDGVWQARAAPRFSRSVVKSPEAPTAAGDETDTLLQELGYTAADIAGFRTEGSLT